jgi:hypothetical protein|tara:strand:- start:1960 stop:2514 length:555 start_codon:yes stop_codon:yes gene_type:complete
MTTAVIDLDTGISVEAPTRLGVDLQGMRSLIESGVPTTLVAKSFHVSVSAVTKFSRDGGWLTPSKVRKLRQEIEEKQIETYRRTGKAADVNEVKAQIWRDRGEYLKEKTFNIAKLALDGVDDDRAARFIQNPLGLSHMTNVVRTITGEEKQDSSGPQLAVNIALLRSSKPVDAIEVESEVLDSE